MTFPSGFPLSPPASPTHGAVQNATPPTTPRTLEAAQMLNGWANCRWPDFGYNYLSSNYSHQLESDFNERFPAEPQLAMWPISLPESASLDMQMPALPAPFAQPAPLALAQSTPSASSAPMSAAMPLSSPNDAETGAATAAVDEAKPKKRAGSKSSPFLMMKKTKIEPFAPYPKAAKSAPKSPDSVDSAPDASGKRKKSKVYKSRYQHKRYIKNKLNAFSSATGDVGAVIFVTKNGHKKKGYDIEFFIPDAPSSETTELNAVFKAFWKEKKNALEKLVENSTWSRTPECAE